MNEEKDIQTNETPTAEDYQALKAELEAERAKAQELVSQATKDLEATVRTLEQELVKKEEIIGQQEKALEGALEEIEGAKAAYAYALEDFRELAAQANPLIPKEALNGSTTEEIKASLQRANDLVSKIKESIQSQVRQTSVPAGAPERTSPDLSALSTREKITYGLEQSRKEKK